MEGLSAVWTAMEILFDAVCIAVNLLIIYKLYKGHWKF